MTNEVALSMQDINTKIKEQIKVSFFNLLPDEEFQKLVNKEVESFFETTSDSCEIHESSMDYNGRSFKLSARVSPFRAIVWAECRRLVDEQIGQWFNKEGLSTITTYFNGIKNDELSPKLNEYMSKHIETASKGFFTQMFSQMFQSFRGEIINDVVNNIPNRY